MISREKYLSLKTRVLRKVEVLIRDRKRGFRHLNNFILKLKSIAIVIWKGLPEVNKKIILIQ